MNDYCCGICSHVRKVIIKCTVRTANVDKKTYKEVVAFVVNLVRPLLLQNAFAEKILKSLTSHNNDLKKWFHSSEVLYFENKLYLPKSLRLSILVRNHNDPLTEHFDIKKIFELLQRKYYWPNPNKKNASSDMRQLIREYCEICVICKRSKISKHKPYEDL